jgi:hypothetical protein
VTKGHVLTPDQIKLIEKLQRSENLTAGFRAALDDASVLLTTIDDALAKVRAERSTLDRIVAEKTICFPWLADAIAQYHELCDLKIAEFLERKLQPGMSAAKRVRELAAEKREFQRKFRLARNRILYYESLFPHLKEYVEEGLDELVDQCRAARADTSDDEVRRWVTGAEYRATSSAERNQLALDRWKKAKKPRWEIGRMYERYVGYQLERCGYSVQYHGITEGLADLGRDLIAAKGQEVQVIQCKRWRRTVPIREKHIFQLFGTTVEWFLKNRGQEAPGDWELFPTLLQSRKVLPVFYTSGILSLEAVRFAKALGVQVHQDIPYEEDYPMIKCNRSHRSNERIYHLPFDQQYDRTTVDHERNECYVATVADAEAKGYRRAWRWRGAEAKL